MTKQTAIMKGLKICEAMLKRQQAFKNLEEKKRDNAFRKLAKSVGLTFDDFCEEMETLSLLDS